MLCCSPSTLKMQAACFSEMSVSAYSITRRQNQRTVVWTIAASKARNRVFCEHWYARLVLQSLQKPAFNVQSAQFKNHPCLSPILSSSSLSFKRFPHQNSACVRRDGRASHTQSAHDICLSIPLPVNTACATSSTKIGNLMTEPESCTVR
jgi:hypothetical protein